MWYLMYRIPLHFAAIPESEIVSACERFNLSADTWRRQDRAFLLLVLYKEKA